MIFLHFYTLLRVNRLWKQGIYLQVRIGTKCLDVANLNSYLWGWTILKSLKNRVQSNENCEKVGNFAIKT